MSEASKFDWKSDPRRWVVATLENNGVSEAQFPLPVNVQGIGVVLHRDVPTIIPYNYVQAVKDAILPRYEHMSEQERSRLGDKARVKSTDEVRFTGIKYAIRVSEIPVEFQTIPGVEKFAREAVKTDPRFEAVKDATLTMESYSPHSYNFSRQVEALLGGKPEEKAKK